jgi:hypothetical protein
MQKEIKTMNEKTNIAVKPRLAFYHPNSKGNGSAAALELLPALGRDEGGVYLTLANQLTVGNRSGDNPTFPTFDWENRITIFLDFFDLCKILQVLRGVKEAIDDGNGMFHRSGRHNTKIVFRHLVDPVAGYSLEIYRTSVDGKTESRARIFFSDWEAVGLMEALTGAMVYVGFGVPQLASSAKPLAAAGAGAQ